MELQNGEGHLHWQGKAVKLEFKNLNVKIEEKTILDDVSGCVKPGEVLAVMGPSGSGKTTLLNFLAGRKVGEVQSGEVLLNGRHITKKLKRKICYVLQEDLFFDNLTLKETLTYTALLRLPDKMPKTEKMKKVEEMIGILDLHKCTNTKIGSYISRGISGGEKKRANIGCELITNPSLILLDEPTSGLDSNNALNLVKILQNFAIKNSKTVVMTIHQPSSQIFYLFDKLLLMASGKVAYYGKASEVMEFFDQAGFHCERHFNPADFVLEVISGGAEVEDNIVNAYQNWGKNNCPAISSEEERGTCSYGLKKLDNKSSIEEQTCDNSKGSVAMEMNEVASLKMTVSSSALLSPDGCGLDNPVMVKDECNNVRDDVEIQVDEEKMEHNGADVNDGNKWPTSFWTQLVVLSLRTFKQSRSVILSKVFISQNILLSIIIGLLWFQLSHKEETIQDRQGLLFFYIMYWGVNPLFKALLTFPTERVIIQKERAAGTYRLSAYFFSKWVSEVPLVLLQPFFFLMVIYWVCGLNASVAFLAQLFNLFLSSLLAQSIGLAIGATIMTFDTALVVAAVFVMANILLGGFYIQKVPFWLEWLSFLSFTKYSYENTLIMEFTGIKEHSCGAEKTTYLLCKTNQTSVLTGEDILAEFKLERTFGENCAILLLFIVVFRTAAYCSLRFLHRPH